MSPDAGAPASSGDTVAPFRIDAGGDPSASPLALEAAAARAERDGFDGVLSVELKHDPFISLALAARATERVRLTSSIAVAFARNPANTAMLANDLQLVSDGRFVLGLGTQVKAHIERRFSMPWSHPARRMREYVQAVRAIWASWETGERLNFRGEFYNHTLMSPMFSPGPNPHGNPPVVLAAVGELMAQTAGEVADGLLAHTFTTRRYLDEVTAPALARGRAASGRTDPVEISLPAFVALGTTDAELATAQAAVKKQIAFYGSTPTYKPVLELHGWESVHEELHRASLNGEWDAMGRLITDEMLDAFAVSGTPVEVAAELRSRFGGVVSRLSFSAPYAVPDEVWAEVLTALRA